MNLTRLSEELRMLRTRASLSFVQVEQQVVLVFIKRIEVFSRSA